MFQKKLNSFLKLANEQLDKLENNDDFKNILDRINNNHEQDIDLTSNSTFSFPGEQSYIPHEPSTKGLNKIFISKLGIRAIGNSLKGHQNKLAIYFDRAILNSYTTKCDGINIVIFDFSYEGDNIDLGISCFKKSNFDNLINFIITNCSTSSSKIQLLKDKLGKKELNNSSFIDDIVTAGNKVLQDSYKVLQESHEKAKEASKVDEDVINLKSSSLSPLPGEKNWIPCANQEFHTVYISSVGIRAISGFPPIYKNKLHIYFYKSRLLSFKHIEDAIFFDFLVNENTISVGIDCQKSLNCAILRDFIISNVKYLSLEMESFKKSIEDRLSMKNKIINYLEQSPNQIVFERLASYRGGILEHPYSADNPGRSCILKDRIIFYDDRIALEICYKQIINVELDYFQLRGGRALLAGKNARMLQEVKNIVAITFLNSNNIKQTLKLQIHGAKTIMGEGLKAEEFLNYILSFNNEFKTDKPDNNDNKNQNSLGLLKELKDLKDAGIITESEFELKKSEILNRL